MKVVLNAVGFISLHGHIADLYDPQWHPPWNWQGRDKLSGFLASTCNKGFRGWGMSLSMQ